MSISQALQIRAQRIANQQAQQQQAANEREQAQRDMWNLAGNAVQQVKGQFQDKVNTAIGNNLMKFSVPQGKFVVKDEEVAWEWNKNATVKRLPTLEEGFEQYKRAKNLSGQTANFAEYYQMHNARNAGYAQMMDSKFKSLEGLGFAPEDVTTALTDKDLIYNLSQVSNATMAGPKGEAINVGVGIGPYLKAVVGKKDRDWWDYREELSTPMEGVIPRGTGLLAGAYTAFKRGKEVIPRAMTEAKGKVAEKLGARQIAKSGLTQKNPTKLMGDLVKYFQSHSSDDLIKLLTSKGFAKKAATKLATRITAVTAAASLGTATAPTGIGAVAGYGAALWGLYDIWTILSDIAPDIQEKVYGDTPSTEF